MSKYPTWTYQQVRERVLNSVRPVPALKDKTATGGVVNAVAALGDCNVNGREDENDIACGGGNTCGGIPGSYDSNANGTPDDCQWDCNANGIHDPCDIDCQVTGCNVSGCGTSDDCDQNGVPDDCEDCDGNGTGDACEIEANPELDMDWNRIIDTCQNVLHVSSEYGDIQSVIDTAEDGDAIVLAAGTYRGFGNKNLNFHGKALTIRCESIGDCEIDCEHAGRGFLLGTYDPRISSVIYGVKVENCAGGSASSAGD